jgi:hypothetical protein
LICTASDAHHHLPKLTLTVTLVNHSNQTLTYTGVTDTNTENIFLVSPKVVLPGGTVWVTSVSNNENVPDMSGNLHFEDCAGKKIIYHVADPHQLHIGFTVPALGDDKYIPVVFAHAGNAAILQST